MNVIPIARSIYTLTADAADIADTWKDFSYPRHPVRTRKPTIREVQPLTQPIRSFSCNAPATASPGGEVESSRRARRAVRKESEAHQMSLESGNNRGAEPLGLWRRRKGLETSKPCAERERPGMTDAPGNATAGSAGTECTRRWLEIRVESSWDGRERPTGGPSGVNREVGLVVGAVGAVHSSDEAANHRRAKGPHLVEVNCEAEDRRWLFLGTR
jgi:hypothetical protein